MDRIDVDVLIVGAGPAGLATAIKLADDCTARGESPPEILVLEKGKSPGCHTLSGAVLDIKSLVELIPDIQERDFPYASVVEKESIYFLDESCSLKLPAMAPGMRSKGDYIVSVEKMVDWLTSIACDKGIDVLPEFSATDVIIEGEQVVGVRVGDKGVSKSGESKGNYLPGCEIYAKVTVLAEGAKGFLTERMIERFSLDEGCNPQVYSAGLKEVWEIPRGAIDTGELVYTLGYPAGLNNIGGGFIYGLNDHLMSLGLVISLDFPECYFDLHDLFQRFKKHPEIISRLKGGTLRGYGVKILPKGGLYSLPRPYANGLLVVGDAGGYLDPERLKGIHMAVKTGILAARTISHAFSKGRFDAETLALYWRLIKESWVYNDLYRCRNFRPAFSGGFLLGSLHYAHQLIFGQGGLLSRLNVTPDHKKLNRMAHYRINGSLRPRKNLYDNKITFDRESAIFYSKVNHAEDQPKHCTIIDNDICRTLCRKMYDCPCLRFCPAGVYEVHQNNGSWLLNTDPIKCLHCRICQVKDPFKNILWVPPEGGGGPQYSNM